MYVYIYIYWCGLSTSSVDATLWSTLVFVGFARGQLLCPSSKLGDVIAENKFSATTTPRGVKK